MKRETICRPLLSLTRRPGLERKREVVAHQRETGFLFLFFFFLSNLMSLECTGNSSTILLQLLSFINIYRPSALLKEKKCGLALRSGRKRLAVKYAVASVLPLGV